LTDDALLINYEATSDMETIINLTHHSYFNLSGHDSRRPAVDDHTLVVNADAITAINDQLIPTGEFMPVTDTPFDFGTPRLVGDRIEEDHSQLHFGHGYDHNFVLRQNGAPAAVLHSNSSGLTMACHTTEPGLQLYTGNFLAGVPGKQGACYGRRAGICLETQHFPDAPNHHHFPSTILAPDETFRSETRYTFCWE
jgi:aldose 1-epimerase